MAELTRAVVPDVTNKVIHPPPQRSTLKVLARCSILPPPRAVAVTFGAGWRGHMGMGARTSRPTAPTTWPLLGTWYRTCRTRCGASTERGRLGLLREPPLRERAGRWTSTAFSRSTRRRRWRRAGRSPSTTASPGCALQGADRSVVARLCAREPRARLAVLPRRELLPAYVRICPTANLQSVNGTHLGHNLPDGKGNRYCINLCSAAAPGG